MNKDKKRNNSLDCLRGLAAINIIFIHTCFWSGEHYVPENMQGLSLVLDVPFFFFLSGWAFSYVCSFAKSIVSLLDIYKKYVIFLVFYIIILFNIGEMTGNYRGMTLHNFYANLFFLKSETTLLPTVMGSIWFMPVYFTVVPIGSFVLSRIWQSANEDKKIFQRHCILLLFIIIMGLLYNYKGGNFFYLSRNCLFYLFFYLLGLVCNNIHINRFAWVAVLIFFDLAVMKLLGVYWSIDISIIQNMKFPPNIIYLLYSLNFVVFALWLKTKLSNVSVNNVLCRIGRSALLFYFCQGISSSLLYFICPKLQMEWFIKLPIAFVCNIFMCFILVSFLHKIYRLGNILEEAIKSVLKTKFF